MTASSPTDEFLQNLLAKKDELNQRLDRINANVRRQLDSDSKERAKELEDREVVDALGNEAREELQKVSAAIERLETGSFGVCVSCGTAIDQKRLVAHPYAEECMDCAIG
ncbi:MAG: TraR/DksA family transcriptional regulator [Woeseiaceae bacterium]